MLSSHRKSGPYPYIYNSGDFNIVIAHAEETKNECLDDAISIYENRPNEYFESDFFKLQEYILAVNLAKSGIPFVNKDEIKDREGNALGEGSSGVAEKGFFHGKECILKEFRKEFDSEHFEPKSLIKTVEGTCNELIAIIREKPSSIMPISGFTLEPFGIVMEFAECGDLFSYVKKNFGTLDFTKKYRIAVGIADGFDWLTNVSGVVHRDIKPDNILLDRTLTPMVSVLRITGIVNPPNENGNAQTRNADNSSLLYTYGRILHFIMTGTELPEGSGEASNPNAVDIVPEKFQGLIEACISKDIAARPNFDTIREELWDAYMDAEFPTKEGTTPKELDAFLEAPKGFWNGKFCRKIEVPLEEIIPIAGVSDKAKGILCGGPSRTVTIHRFLLLYRSFGRWYEQSSPDHDKTFELISQEWFMENQGKTALTNYSEGMFYVRIASADSDAPFTLECRNGGQVKKLRIYFNNETKKYNFGKQGVEYDSVIGLIEGLKEGHIIGAPYKPAKGGYSTLKKVLSK